jgi:hypothetical protein
MPLQQVTFKALRPILGPDTEPFDLDGNGRGGHIIFTGQKNIPSPAPATLTIRTEHRAFIVEAPAVDKSRTLGDRKFRKVDEVLGVSVVYMEDPTL